MLFMNVFFVHSSLPLYIGYEVNKENKKPSICFLCNDLLEYSESDINFYRSNFNEVIVLSIFGVVQKIKSIIKVFLRLRNVKIEDLYVGNIGANLLTIAYNIFKCKRKFILEDGASTLSFIEKGIDNYNLEKPSYSKISLFKKFLHLRDEPHVIISLFDLKKGSIETQKLKSTSTSESRPKLTPDLLIFGGPETDLGVISLELYEEKISELISYFKNKTHIENILSNQNIQAIFLEKPIDSLVKYYMD